MEGSRSFSFFAAHLQVLFKLKASPAAFSGGRAQAAYLSARSGTAAANAGFTTSAKLPYQCPSSDNTFLTIDVV